MHKNNFSEIYLRDFCLFQLNLKLVPHKTVELVFSKSNLELKHEFRLLLTEIIKMDFVVDEDDIWIEDYKLFLWNGCYYISLDPYDDQAEPNVNDNLVIVCNYIE